MYSQAIPDRLILFDGQCALCHTWVRFVLRFDHAQRFRFTALQSPTGQQILDNHQLTRDHFDTFWYLEHGTLYSKSRAALRIIRQLPLPIKLLFMVAIIPTPMLDRLYDLLAQRRYALFGSKDLCALTESTHQDRFI